MAFDNFRPNYGDASGSCSTLSTDQENVTVNTRPTENVMPLELAIKRELDYRMRLESLPGARFEMTEPSPFLRPPPVPGQGIIGKKRKISSGNLRICPTQQPRSSNSRHPVQNRSGKLLCTLCQISFSSKSALRQHRQESEHKKNLLESQNKSKQGKNKPVWCKLCRISCSDDRAFTQHLAGKKHAASVHAIEAAKSIKEDTEKKVLTVKWDELEWDTVA